MARELDTLVKAAEDMVRLNEKLVRLTIRLVPDEARTPVQRALVRLNAALRPFRRT